MAAALKQTHCMMKHVLWKDEDKLNPEFTHVADDMSTENICSCFKHSTVPRCLFGPYDASSVVTEQQRKHTSQQAA